jgi:hypothetical protein
MYVNKKRLQRHSAAKQSVSKNKSLHLILVFVSLTAKYFIRSDGI